MTKARRWLRALPRFAVFACAGVVVIAWIASFAVPFAVSFDIDLATRHNVTLALTGESVFFMDSWGSTSKKKPPCPRALSIERVPRGTRFTDLLHWSQWTPHFGTGTFVADGFDESYRGKNTFANMPLWIPTLLVALLIAFMVYSRRTKPGECPHCRYDKQGLPSAVCPECGKAFVRKS